MLQWLLLVQGAGILRRIWILLVLRCGLPFKKEEYSLDGLLITQKVKKENGCRQMRHKGGRTGLASSQPLQIPQLQRDGSADWYPSDLSVMTLKVSIRAFTLRPGEACTLHRPVLGMCLTDIRGLVFMTPNSRLRQWRKLPVGPRALYIHQEGTSGDQLYNCSKRRAAPMPTEAETSRRCAA